MVELAGDQLRVAKAFAIDLVYPKRCAGCARRGSWLCDECDADFELFAPPWCQTCGVPLRFQCRCQSIPEGIECVRSVGPFEGWLRGAIVQCKYHGEWGRTEHLAGLLAAVADDLRPFDALVPVPLHSSRLRHRGFNQSSLLALHAAKFLDVPVEDVLVRTRRTHAQVRLGAAERLTNVRGAIQVQPEFETMGRTFMVIDDVVTTGSTLGACAQALIEAGAASVKALTVTREM